MSRYSRWGFFKNKHSAGTGELTPTATYSISESSNTTATVFTISTNITSEPTIPYTITGTNLLSNDFDDNSLNGNITLNANGNATITKTITNNNINSDTIKTFQLFLQRNATSGNVANSNVITIQSFEPIQYSTSGGDDPFLANLDGLQYTFTNFQTGYGPTDFQFTRRGSNANAIVEFVTVGGGGGGGQAYRLYRAGAEEYRMQGASGAGGEVAFANISISNIDMNRTMNVSIGAGGNHAGDWVGNGNAADMNPAGGDTGGTTGFYITGTANVNLYSAGGSGGGPIGSQPVAAFLQPFPDANLAYNLGGDGGDSPNASGSKGYGGLGGNNFGYLPASSNGSDGIGLSDQNGAQIAHAINSSPTANFIYVAGAGLEFPGTSLGTIGKGGNSQRVTSGPAVNPPSIYQGTDGNDGAVFVKFPYFDSYNEIV
jgi:hypothetical protein